MTPEFKIYSLYGLRVGSALALPCPEVADGEADVELVEASEEAIAARTRQGTVHLESDTFWECRYFEDKSARVAWRDHFEFHVASDGARVLWRRLVGVPDEVLLTYLLNQVLSHCLVARGIEPLHATGVVVGGGAIALMGDSGYGKSTLAATLLRRGHPLLTDDLLVLDMSGGAARAYPSLPRLKLSPDSADATFGGRRALPMNTFTDKMILPLEASEHVAHPVPMRAIFVIPSDIGADSISVRRVTGHEALLPIVRNTFENSFLHPRRVRQQFDFACRVAASVPTSVLEFPREMALLPEVADTLLASLAEVSRTP